MNFYKRDREGWRVETLERERGLVRLILWTIARLPADKLTESTIHKRSYQVVDYPESPDPFESFNALALCA
jgi:hypothetical protein